MQPQIKSCPSISIVNPAYNIASLIGQTLESVVRNKADMDIIVGDDASTDNNATRRQKHMGWRRFLAINTSLTSHRLVPGREQHTNTFDERRLEMFRALEDAEKLIAENRIFRAKYYPVFVIFKAGLLEWVNRQIRQDLRSLFREYASYSCRHFTDDDFDRVYRINPGIALGSYRTKHSHR